MLDVDNKTFIDRSKDVFYMCTVSLTVMLFACKKNVIAHKTLSNNLTKVHLNLNF